MCTFLPRHRAVNGRLHILNSLDSAFPRTPFPFQRRVLSPSYQELSCNSARVSKSLYVSSPVSMSRRRGAGMYVSMRLHLGFLNE